MKKCFIYILLLAFATACSNEETEEVNFLDPIEVELNSPEDIQVNEEVVTEAIVSQNGKRVSDVSEAIFEIWQHGNSDSYEKLEGKKVDQGIYKVNWTPKDEGLFYVYYHITASGIHRMEKVEYIVGHVDVEKIKATPDEKKNSHMH